MCDLGWGCGCHSYAQRLWTSQSVLVDGGRDGPELCGIINAALRDDDPALAPPLAAVARAINQAPLTPRPTPTYTHARTHPPQCTVPRPRSCTYTPPWLVMPAVTAVTFAVTCRRFLAVGPDALAPWPALAVTGAGSLSSSRRLSPPPALGPA